MTRVFLTGDLMLGRGVGLDNVGSDAADAGLHGEALNRECLSRERHLSVPPDGTLTLDKP